MQQEHSTEEVPSMASVINPERMKAVLEEKRTALQAQMKNVQLPSVGRIVHYVLGHGRHPGEHRPAIIVKLWGTPTPDYIPAVQLQVFTDGTNDFEHGAASSGLLWATSVAYSEEPKPYTWHWPERV